MLGVDAPHVFVTADLTEITHQTSYHHIESIRIRDPYRNAKMPHHPSEEEAPGGIYEKVARDPLSTTESTASEHGVHHNEHAPEAGAKASTQDMQSKGPQIPMDMNGMIDIPTM